MDTHSMWISETGRMIPALYMSIHARKVMLGQTFIMTIARYPSFSFVPFYWCSSVFSPPTTKLGQGNIFRSVCQKFCPGGKVCMAAGACIAGGWCAWWETSVAGGMHGRGMHGRGACDGGCVWWGTCMAAGVCMAGGHAWKGGVHSMGHAGHACSPPKQILRDTVNERAICILLECILFSIFVQPSLLHFFLTFTYSSKKIFCNVLQDSHFVAYVYVAFLVWFTLLANMKALLYYARYLQDSQFWFLWAFV